MRDDRDYKLELSSAKKQEPITKNARPFLSVHFACCNVYCRIYRNLDGTCYEGRCTRCARSITFGIGSDGTDSRSFIVK
ncbi:hypothetical protein BH09PLA1_BH09PLA1_35230 [soil metagenome]